MYNANGDKNANDADGLIYENISYKLNGMCYKIQNELGRCLNEKQYADAFEKSLIDNSIRYNRENPLNQSFDGEKTRRNIPDFIVEDKIIIDFKAKRIISKEDYYQMQRYLNSANKKLGIIYNFRQKYIKPKRVLNSKAEI